MLKFTGAFAAALDKVADILSTVHIFLNRALNALVQVVEVVIESELISPRESSALAKNLPALSIELPKRERNQLLRMQPRQVKSLANKTEKIAEKFIAWISHVSVPLLLPNPFLSNLKQARFRAQLCPAKCGVFIALSPNRPPAADSKAEANQVHINI